MNRVFSLVTDQFSDVMLRTSQWDDLDKLRNWKNSNRRSFFFQELITIEMQQAWFEAYLDRQDDFMFIINVAESDIGCMAFRLQEMEWDVYNVILGVTEFGGKGYMGQALWMMCSFAIARRPLPITAKVLSSNPALQWYYRNGFQQRDISNDHVEIKLDVATFIPCINTKENFHVEASGNR